MTTSGTIKEDDDNVYTEIRNSAFEIVDTSNIANRPQKQKHNINDRADTRRTKILFVFIGVFICCVIAGIAIYCIIRIESKLKRKISQLEDELNQLKEQMTQYKSSRRQNDMFNQTIEKAGEGRMGTKGEKGQTGDRGTKGEKGELGYRGSHGIKGRNGQKGETGQTGNVAMPVVLFQANRLKFETDLKGRRIVFITITTNIGGGYNKVTGLFTSPQSGVYLFTLQICPESSKKVAMEIFASNKVIGRLNVFHDHDDGPCVSTSGITVLTKGNQVWIRCNDADTGDSVYNLNGNIFAGVLLHTGT